MAKYDVVLWGATGFTGKLVSQYFAEHVSLKHPSLRWALAGRSLSKLQEVAAQLPSQVRHAHTRTRTRAHTPTHTRAYSRAHTRTHPTSLSPMSTNIKKNLKRINRVESETIYL